MIYLNIFDLSKSQERISSSQEPKELLEWFLEDIAELAAHHHGLQSVDFADPEERAEAELPEGDICPFCLKETPQGEFEYNHSHFDGDNLNKHLDRYVCKTCNLKCTLRQKPLKFYGHNF
jgi:DNA repair exonuclease SbcCD ATPase subunit